MFAKMRIFSFLVSFHFSLFLNEIHCNGLTQEELCPTDEKRQFTNFKVNAAFKIGKYITVIGQLWRESESPSDAKNATIRVLHIPEKLDPTRLDKPYNFFEAKVWNEIQGIEDKKKIQFAFNTDKMDSIFILQKMSEIVFVVQDTNTTTAYQFDYNKIESSKEPTFDPRFDVKKVYDPSDGFDESEYLNIKFLLIHFPHGVRVLSILIFDRTRGAVVQLSDQFKPKMRLITQNYPTYYAIVYTEEMFKGKPYYFRHYMRSERHKYKDFKGSRDYNFYRLDWFFDENIDFCDELSRAPTAVTLLSKRETFVSIRDENKVVIHFMEFYGLKHKLMKISFESQWFDKYVIAEESLKTNVQSVEVNNGEALLNCKPHPISANPSPIPCEDYPKEMEDAIPKQGETLFESQDSEQSTSFLFTFALIIIILVIVVLMGVGIYLTVSPN